MTLEELTSENAPPSPQHGLPKRLNLDAANAEKGVAQLVLTLVELLRQLLEKQALHRMDAGTVSDDEIERMGETFIKLEQQVTEMCQQFGIDKKDLNIDLGPLGDLM
jgi:Gas vesicle protein K